MNSCLIHIGKNVYETKETLTIPEYPCEDVVTLGAEGDVIVDTPWGRMLKILLFLTAMPDQKHSSGNTAHYRFR